MGQKLSFLVMITLMIASLLPMSIDNFFLYPFLKFRQTELLHFTLQLQVFISNFAEF